MQIKDFTIKIGENCTCTSMDDGFHIIPLVQAPLHTNKQVFQKAKGGYEQVQAIQMYIKSPLVSVLTFIVIHMITNCGFETLNK